MNSSLYLSPFSTSNMNKLRQKLYLIIVLAFLFLKNSVRDSTLLSSPPRRTFPHAFFLFPSLLIQTHFSLFTKKLEKNKNGLSFPSLHESPPKLFPSFKTQKYFHSHLSLQTPQALHCPMLRRNCVVERPRGEVCEGEADRRQPWQSNG